MPTLLRSRRNAVAPIPASVPNQGSVNVLLVDDDSTFREALAAHLTAAGFSVRQAQHGDEAVDIYLRHPGLQVVVTDIFMPRMDGIEVIEYFHGIPGIRVIALGSASPEGVRLDDAARRVGAFAVIDKDDLSGLSETIRAARQAALV